MNSKEIRKKFLQFFESKKHEVVSSAPIVVKNDPTLMFINAGMNQFKDYFLGNQIAENPRVTNSQKCLRVSGKHNDLEEVGVDTYHHTMFEMLGNWSFGDYFKEEAIKWAWELLVDVYKLPQDRIYITVFEGDATDKLEADNEAIDIWSSIIPKEKILLFDRKDNFWEMGETGPCGPCSEIHIDLRDASEVEKIPGEQLVNKDHPQVIEIWNLVFMQFNRMGDGSLVELPSKHIDTGMGFERLTLAIQNKKSNYDTDIFQPLITYLADRAGVSYGDDEKIDIAIRVMSDHIRAIAFAIADGQLPSNTGAGYVIRRILRRAVRYGYTFLNFEEPILFKLVEILSGQFEEVFPEIKKQQGFIERVVEEEETSFLRTLNSGIKRLDSITSDLKPQGMISGDKVFELYDTYGFPVDLTALIAREAGYEIDEAGFNEAMSHQKTRSRKAAAVSTGDWVEVKASNDVEFVGYDQLTQTSAIIKYRKVEDKKKAFFQIVLDKTPFYAESGGQVGDKGFLTIGEEKIIVFDTKKENDLIVHYCDKIPVSLEKEVLGVVDEDTRRKTTNNHTATHLLQSALREILGDHVQQKGSLVNDKVLRFDFSHFAKMTPEEIILVEKLVNKKIRANISLDEKRDVPMAEAQKMGATALFGEKYGDAVRVITFDPTYSVELCGGTHVNSTGAIGMFKILSESSVAAGVRRIEAITADAAYDYFFEQQELMTELSELLKNPKDVVKSVHTLIETNKKQAKKLELQSGQQSQNLKQDLLDKVVHDGFKSLIIEQVEADSADVLKQISFDIKNKVPDLAMVLAANIDEKPLISVMLSDSLVSSGLNASQIVRELAKEIKGGGGGQPFFATAGGKDLSGLPHVVTKAKELLA